MNRDWDAAEHYAEAYQAALDSLRNTLIDLDESGGTDDTEIVRGPSTPRVLRG